MDTTLIPVCVGACLCPGTPHADGDFVYLRPKLGLAAGIALQKLIVDASQDRPDAADLVGRLAEAYLIYGVAEWNLEGEHGALLVTADAIREHLLSDFERSAPAADAADDLYMGPVIAPLLKRARESLPTMPTNGSTSAQRNGSPKRPKRSKPSSTTTTPTAATATTSTLPVGGSSSSES